jgi:hypothetical protein
MNQPHYTQHEQDDALEQLERGLLETINTLSELNVMVENFDTGSEHNWFNKLNTLLDNYRNVKDIGRAYDVVLPQQVVDHVDNGTSPTQFMSVVQQAAVENYDLTNGRQTIFKVCFQNVFLLFRIYVMLF